MDWFRHHDRTGFTLAYPAGWRVQTLAAPAVTVSSPDGLRFVVIQPVPAMPGIAPADVIRQGRFPTANLFPAAQPGEVVAGDNGGARGVLAYKSADGSPGRAHLQYVPSAGGHGMLYAIAAPASAFAEAEPTLSRIVESLAQPTPASPPSAAPFKFVEPQYGSFTLDVPAGWRVTGGLHRPLLGDRRPWFEAVSPDGVYVLSDPLFPQTLCHAWGGATGRVVPVGAGGFFLSLKPGAETSADFYLARIGPGRLPGFAPVGRRPRPDVVTWLKAVQASIAPVGRKALFAAVETTLARRDPGRPAGVASLLTTCIFDGNYGFGTGFWASVNVLCVSPEPLAAAAEAARTRMLMSMSYTPAMFQVAQQDEAQILANGQAANAAQWQWFAGQQAAHHSQEAVGDLIVNNYWSQQRASELGVRGWEQSQASYDRLSQDRGDATMDRQRLADDAAGQQYDVSAGSDYYWLDPHTGAVVGTPTDQPPDLLSGYTSLRKL